MELNPIIRRKQGSSGGGGLGGVLGTILGAAGGFAIGGPSGALQGASLGNTAGSLVGGVAKPAEAPLNSTQEPGGFLDKANSIGGSALGFANTASKLGSGTPPPSYGQSAGGYGGANLGVDTDLPGTNPLLRRMRRF